MAIALFVSLLILSPIVDAQSMPTTADSNVKISMNQSYMVSWESIIANYSGPNAPHSIVLHELPLHGDLNWGELYSPYTLALAGEAFWYTPDYDFQGADHFKYQIYDGYNYSNISSYNFDILNLHQQHDWIYCPEDADYYGSGDHGVSTNNFGGGSLNYHDSSTNYGTGGGGDDLITNPKPIGGGGLIRTGGFSL